MFFIASKLLVFLLKPLNWAIILGLLSLILKNQKRRVHTRWAAFVVLLFFSNPLIINQLYLQYEFPPRTAASLQDTFDIGILLGGYSNFEVQSPIDFHPFGPSGSRFTQAFELYKTHKVRKILLSGGAGALIGEGMNESDRVVELLHRLGVPEADILVENKSRNTHENAVFSKKLIDSIRPNATCLLLTSAWHLPRAQGCFEKIGCKTTPFPVDFFGKTCQIKPSHLIEPDDLAFMKWGILIKEWLGLAAYKSKGYL